MYIYLRKESERFCTEFCPALNCVYQSTPNPSPTHSATGTAELLDHEQKQVDEIIKNVSSLWTGVASNPRRLKIRPGVHCMGVSAHARHNYPESG